MKAYGIDISQHRLCVTERDEGGIRATPNLQRSLPCALLPLHRHESMVLAAKFPKSTVGLGFPWPPEASIPVGGVDRARGCGRIPLVACLAAVKHNDATDDWQIVDSRTGWRPSNKDEEISLTNAELIRCAFPEDADEASCALVVPDELSEGAQQFLLDGLPLGTILVPQGVALALAWCRNEGAALCPTGLREGEERSLGKILTASMGMGEWTLSVLEILAVCHNGEVSLVPVLDPSLRGGDVGFCGLSLCSVGSTVAKGFSPVNWRRLCLSNWFEKDFRTFADSTARVTPSMILREPTIGCVPFDGIPAFEGLRRSNALKEHVRYTVASRLIPRLKASAQCPQFLAVVAGGSMAALRPQKDSPITIAQLLFAQEVPRDRLFVLAESACSAGAAFAAWGIQTGELTYRIRNVPLSLFSIGRNELHDKVARWQTLVSEGTINAGEEYELTDPIRGLFIPEGMEYLEVTLRRPDGRQGFDYRSVKARIPMKTVRREPVIITTKVKPGQGFARVSVVSERLGVFATSLDWRTMQEVEKTEVRLEYIPNVSYVVCDHALWLEASEVMLKFIRVWEATRRIEADDVSFLVRYFNKWRRDRHSTDVYRYVGPICSGGLAAEQEDAATVRRFCSLLAEAWQFYRGTLVGNRLLRLGGWMYQFIPKKMLDDVVNALRRGEDRSFYLHVAGLCFHTDEQLKCFYRAFCEKEEPSAEWFRALRNLVRFRDHALSDDVVDDAAIDWILDWVVHNLLTYSVANQRNKFNNSIECIIYLLKRRRYSEDFLRMDDPRTLAINEVLKCVARTHPTKRLRELAVATLAFLNKEATQDTLTAILTVAEGDEDNE